MHTIVAAVMAIFFVMAPPKPYIKPGEPVAVQFAQSDSDQAQKTYEVVGLKALDLPNLFKPVSPQDIVDASGAPLFQLYSLADGQTKPLTPAAAPKPDLSTGTLDIATFFPQIRESGTYILTWKSATPLVIETLANPGFTKFVFDSIPPDQRASLPKQALEQFEPVAIHIVPLQGGIISTDKGDIKITFAYDVAPHTIQNFIDLSDQKFYDGTVFHRIIKGFMIQGGDSLGASETRAGTGSAGHGIVQEFSAKSHIRGVLSMARSQEPDSGGSQFFIMLAEKTHLNGQYTAFGQVIDGMDVVDKIAETPVTDENGSTKPADRPAIKSIHIIPATPEMYGIKN